MMEQLNGKRAHFNSRLLTETNDYFVLEAEFETISIHVSLRRRTKDRVASGQMLIDHFNSRLLTETNSEKNQYA